jgi:hypothetical protein
VRREKTFEVLYLGRVWFRKTFATEMTGVITGDEVAARPSLRNQAESRPGATPFSSGQKLIADFKKPTGCLLGACSGRHPVGYRLLTHPVVFRSHYSVETRTWKKVSRSALNFLDFLNTCKCATYSGIAGGREAISSVKRASLRSPANSGSLYTSLIPL